MIKENTKLVDIKLEFINQKFINDTFVDEKFDLTPNLVFFKVLKNILTFKRIINKYQLIINIPFDIFKLITEKLGYFSITISDGSKNIKTYIRITEYQKLTALEDSSGVKVSVIGDSLVFSRLTYESNLYNFDFYDSKFNQSSQGALSNISTNILSGSYTTSDFLLEVLLGAGFNRIYGNVRLKRIINDEYLSKTIFENVRFNQDFDLNIIKKFINNYYPILDHSLLIFDDFSSKNVLGDATEPKIFCSSLNTVFDTPEKFRNPLIESFNQFTSYKQYNIIDSKSKNNIDKNVFFKKAYGKYIINSYVGPKIIDDEYINKPVFLNDKIINIYQLSSYVKNIEVPVAKKEILQLRENYKKLINKKYSLNILKINNYDIFQDYDIGSTSKVSGKGETPRYYFFYDNDISFIRYHRTQEFRVEAELSFLEF